jgi:hypothetical protein
MNSIEKSIALAWIVLGASGCSSDSSRKSPSSPQPESTSEVTVHVDASTSFQTIRGWEVVDFALDPSPAFERFINPLLERVVNEVGINSIRLEVWSGAEHAYDNWTRWQNGEISYEQWRAVRQATVNDNSDANSIKWSGFHFSRLDDKVVRLVEPLRRLLEDNGETLYTTLTYVAFTKTIEGGTYDHDDPAEYAEFILATFQHLDETFGFVPDALEILLEPDNVPEWTEDVMGAAIVAVADRLAANGYQPEVIAPSTTKMATAPEFIRRWAETDGILQRVHTLSYHRYRGFSERDLEEVVQTAAAHGLETAMLEWWDRDNGYKILHNDLAVGMNSVWHQGAMGGTPDSKMSLYRIDDSDPLRPVITINDPTRFTRQYFKFVRSGARRIAASSQDGSLHPLGFVNTNGGYIVVVKADKGAEFTVGGVPPGTYGATYATSSEWDVRQPDQTIVAGQPLRVSIPAEGVITIFPK